MLDTGTLIELNEECVNDLEVCIQATMLKLKNMTEK